MSDEVNQAHEPVPHIEDLGHGEYILYLDDVAVVRIGNTYATKAIRQCHWMIYGPTDVNWSIALMKGFLQLTALLANETRAMDLPPVQVQTTKKFTRKKS